MSRAHEEIVADLMDGRGAQDWLLATIPAASRPAIVAAAKAEQSAGGRFGSALCAQITEHHSALQRA